MHVLTLVADPATAPLSATLVEKVRRGLSAGAPVWLSGHEAVDLPLDAPADRQAVDWLLGGAPVDAIAGPAAGRRKALLVADMDSTIVTSETLDELATEAGVGEAVASITRRSMNGEVDFSQALRERVALLRGVPLAALEAVWRRTSLMPGAAQLVATMRAHGATTALVSGGFRYFTARVAALVGFDEHHANELLDDGAALLGTVTEPILDRDAKRAVLHRLAAAHGLALSATLAVGDGANDLDMVRAAGLGVAFRAKPVLAERAPARIDHCGLRALLFAQGYTASEIVGPA
jgi:phosphoserine phosphatase